MRSQDKQKGRPAAASLMVGQIRKERSALKHLRYVQVKARQQVASRHLLSDTIRYRHSVREMYDNFFLFIIKQPHLLGPIGKIIMQLIVNHTRFI